MVTINNLFDNTNVKQLASMGQFTVLEYQKDLSVGPESAQRDWFMQEMNVRKRQVLIQLNNTAAKVQAGAMQWISGNVEMTSGVGGIGGLFKKAVSGAVTGESVAKPIYKGQGCVMLEPTYRYILLEDVSTWGSGMMLDDGLFLAADVNIKEEVVSRKNISSALLGGEGLFNLSLSGNGIAVLESAVPREELIEFVLDNDVVKIDGNMAIAWSKSLRFTVEKSTKSIIGSAVSGEGFVNVYRGTGKILVAPTLNGTAMSDSNAPKQTAASSSKGIAGSVVSSLMGS